MTQGQFVGLGSLGPSLSNSLLFSSSFQRKSLSCDFSRDCDKIPNQSSSRKEGLVWARSGTGKAWQWKCEVLGHRVCTHKVCRVEWALRLGWPSLFFCFFLFSLFWVLVQGMVMLTFLDVFSVRRLWNESFTPVGCLECSKSSKSDLNLPCHANHLPGAAEHSGLLFACLPSVLPCTYIVLYLSYQ